MINLNCSTSSEMTLLTGSDAAWILKNAFLVMTMQSGFGLLEAGCVSGKNYANIMVKNFLDVICGGLTYWLFGYGLSFGRSSNAYIGLSDFSPTSLDDDTMKHVYVSYVFQFSFASTATTIVSGAAAERMTLISYTLFATFNTLVYSVPAGWAWGSRGFLRQLGFFDFAGACIVHVHGGASALITAYMLQPRLGAFSTGPNRIPQMTWPVMSLSGTFILWWAWLGFNAGSTMKIKGNAWQLAALVSVNTLNASIGGGVASILTSFLVHRCLFFDIGYLITGVLGGLVGIIACCSVVSPAESVLIGAVAALAGISCSHLLSWCKIDDPVNAVGVHFGSGIVGILVVGLNGRNVRGSLNGQCGWFYNCGFRLLGVQTLGLTATVVWTCLFTFLVLFIIDKTLGIRMSVEEEIMGVDFMEHGTVSISLSAIVEMGLLRTGLSPTTVQKFIRKHGDDLLNGNRNLIRKHLREVIQSKLKSKVVRIANNESGMSEQGDQKEDREQNERMGRFERHISLITDSNAIYPGIIPFG